MNAGVLPLLFLSAALGLSLSATIGRGAWLSFATFVAMALLVTALVGRHDDWENAVFISLWIGTAILAILVYLPNVLSTRAVLAVGIIAGLGVGMAGLFSGGIRSVLPCVSAALIFLPGRWIVQRGYGVSVKVAASWIIAISVLAAMVTLTPTPGYKPDHME